MCSSAPRRKSKVAGENLLSLRSFRRSLWEICELFVLFVCIFNKSVPIGGQKFRKSCHQSGTAVLIKLVYANLLKPTIVILEWYLSHFLALASRKRRTPPRPGPARRRRSECPPPRCPQYGNHLGQVDRRQDRTRQPGLGRGSTRFIVQQRQDRRSVDDGVTRHRPRHAGSRSALRREAVRLPRTAGSSVVRGELPECGRSCGFRLLRGAKRSRRRLRPRGLCGASGSPGRHCSSAGATPPL